MRADRLLSILLLLQVHRRLTARELAHRMEVSERTILRDMDALSGSGVPVVAERGSNGGWRLLEDYRTNLTGLDAAEIQSLFLAKPARLLADLGLKQECRKRLLIKLLASLPQASRQQAERARQKILIEARGVGATLRKQSPAFPCCWMRSFASSGSASSIAARAAKPNERTGTPLGLVAKGSVWYLIAGVDAEPRTYRVSRMQNAAVFRRLFKARSLDSTWPLIGSAPRANSVKSFLASTRPSAWILR